MTEYIFYKESNFPLVKDPIYLEDETAVFTYEGSSKKIDYLKLAMYIGHIYKIKVIPQKNRDSAIYYIKNLQNNIYYNSPVVIDLEINRVYEFFNLNPVSMQTRNKIFDIIRVNFSIQDLSCFAEMNNENIDFINIKNGILNLKTKELIISEKIVDIERKEFFSNLNFLTYFDFSYDETINDSYNSKFDKFLKEILSEKQDQLTIYEFIGYCLYRSCFLQKFTYFVGNGLNGKTTLLIAIFEFLNTHNYSLAKFEEIFSDDRFAKISLFLKYLLAQKDLDSLTIEKIGQYKDFCDGSEIETDRKNLSRIKFNPFGKGVACCNHTPKAKTIKENDSFAFKRRNHFIEFTVEIEKTKLKNQIDLVNEITTEKEKSFILYQALEGLNRLLKNKKYSNEEKLDINSIRFQQLNNTALYFIEKNLISSDKSEGVFFQSVYQKYIDFCNTNKLVTESEKTIAILLRNKLFFPNSDPKRKINSQTGKKEVFYYGMEFNNDIDNINLNIQGDIIKIFENNKSDDLSINEVYLDLLTKKIHIEIEDIEKIFDDLLENGVLNQPVSYRYKLS